MIDTVVAWAIVVAFAMAAVGTLAMAFVVLFRKINEGKGQHVSRKSLHRPEEPQGVHLRDVQDGDPEG